MTTVRLVVSEASFLWTDHDSTQFGYGGQRLRAQAHGASMTWEARDGYETLIAMIFKVQKIHQKKPTLIVDGYFLSCKLLPVFNSTTFFATVFSADDATESLVDTYCVANESQGKARVI